MSHLKRPLIYLTLLLLGGGLLAPLVTYATLTLDSTSLTSDGALTVKSASSSLTIIGQTNQTAAITLASSSETLTLNLGTGTGATTVNIATGTSTAKTVNIANGTGAHTINIGTGGTNAKTINIGTAANTLNVVTIGAASSTIAFTSASWTVTTAGTSTIVNKQTVTSSTFPTSPVNGQVVLLRAGESPYEFLEMTYDATYGKWVSDPTILNRTMDHGNGLDTTLSATYDD